MTLSVFFLFQAFEQQSFTSHSRHALRQHAQPSAAVSTLFICTSIRIYCILIRRFNYSSEIYSLAVNVAIRLAVASVSNNGWNNIVCCYCCCWFDGRLSDIAIELKERIT
jgi:hypothetical protein